MIIVLNVVFVRTGRYILFNTSREHNTFLYSNSNNSFIATLWNVCSKSRWNHLSGILGGCSFIRLIGKYILQNNSELRSIKWNKIVLIVQYLFSNTTSCLQCWTGLEKNFRFLLIGVISGNLSSILSLEGMEGFRFILYSTAEKFYVKLHVIFFHGNAATQKC